MKKEIYKLLPFVPRINFFIGVKLRRFIIQMKKHTIIKELATQKSFYANIGCGNLGLETGWINLDYGKYEHVTYLYDCRKQLPFADYSAKGLFTEHFFEHLDYYEEVPYFLKSCFNALQIDGTLRIIIPDAEKYLIGYCYPNWKLLKETRPLNDELEDQLMGIKYATKMQLINEVFRQGGQHKYAWDFETIKLALQLAGFRKIYKMAYKKTNDENLSIDQLIRQPESLYVEAIKE